jgi:hypothetical protein
MPFKLKTNALIALVLALPLASATHTAAQDAARAQPGARVSSSVEPRFLKAFVVDDRLSVLRREADLKSQALRRLRLGRPVYIIGSSSSKAGEPRFYRVAVTRRTRGWIHASAVAIPSRAGEDKRVLQLAETAADGFDRIELSLLLNEGFRTSPLVPRALLMIGGEAERAVSTLSKRAGKRVATINPEIANAPQRDYYLNDTALDRFSKLRISFDFDEEAGEYVYDGAAYRAVIKRFPASESAKIARQRLELVEKRLARRK